VSGLLTPKDIEVDVTDGLIYWCDDEAGKIQRASLDTFAVEDVVTGLSRVNGIALDRGNGKLYWSQGNAYTECSIRRANIDGSHMEILLEWEWAGPSDVDLDLTAGKMYWAEPNLNGIFRADLEGSGLERLTIAPGGAPRSVALDLDAGKLYWTDSYRGIWAANLDGTDAVRLPFGDRPWGIALDSQQDRLFYVDRYGNPGVFCVVLDEGQPIRISIGGSPIGVEYVVPEPGTLALLAMGGLAVIGRKNLRHRPESFRGH